MKGLGGIQAKYLEGNAYITIISYDIWLSWQNGGICFLYKTERDKSTSTILSTLLLLNMLISKEPKQTKKVSH